MSQNDAIGLVQEHERIVDHLLVVANHSASRAGFAGNIRSGSAGTRSRCACARSRAWATTCFIAADGLLLEEVHAEDDHRFGAAIRISEISPRLDDWHRASDTRYLGNALQAVFRKPCVA